MTILNDRELGEAHAALGNLYRALRALRSEAAHSTSTFSLIAEGPLNEIGRIRREIEAYSGVEAAEREAAPLWLDIHGPCARWGETSTSVVTGALEALRKGIQSIVAFGSLTPTSRDIQRACDLELVAFRPGSFRVGVRLPDPTQSERPPADLASDTERALQEFISAAAWAGSSGEQDDLAALFDDFARRRVVLQALKKFVPRRNTGVDFIELTGSAVGEQQSIRLSPDAIQWISAASKSIESDVEAQFVGEIRELDLDKMRFQLRNVPGVGEVACQFGGELSSTVSSSFGQRVRVVGTRTDSPGSPPGRLNVSRVEMVD